MASLPLDNGGGLVGNGQGRFIDKKNVSSASYIAAFVNNTKGLQWTQATKWKFIEAENLGSHRCDNCSIITFIYEHRVIKKILVHLDLLRGEEQKRGPPAPLKKCSEVVVEPFDDGWPEYKKAFIDVQTL